MALTSKGLVALDRKILLDDKASFRQQDFFNGLQEEQQNLDKRVKTLAEQLAQGTGIAYVPLDGDVGMIADGAGTGMLTLDLIHYMGGRRPTSVRWVDFQMLIRWRSLLRSF